MKCSEFNEIVDLVISNEEIDSELELDFKHHMKNCKSCRESYERSLKMVKKLENIKLPLISKEFIKKTIPMLHSAYKRAAIVQHYYEPERSGVPVFGITISVVAVIALFTTLIGILQYLHSDTPLFNFTIPEFSITYNSIIAFSYGVALFCAIGTLLFYYYLKEKHFS